MMKTAYLPKPSLPAAPCIGTTDRFQVYTERHFDQIESLARLPEALRFAMRVVANVLPFRANRYVIDELIDWRQVPSDPMFQLVFPQPEMLEPHQFEAMADLLRRGADGAELKALARRIRTELNPHPADQRELNVPVHEGERLPGLQHKYRETVLFFPSQGQTCHSYCTFCFRWAQFVGDKELRFAANEADKLHDYLRAHPEVSDLLLTGGDPLVMKSRHLAAYLEPLLGTGFEHVSSIRLGTKAITFWPQRFVTDPDADELLRLFERVAKAGKQLAVMAHFNHWREFETPIAQEAIRRIRRTGATIRSQSPLIRHINDDPLVWARMWREQSRLGIIPYYLFVERDTGPKRYFELPLAQAWAIYRDAMRQVSGLARTVRGPSMSAGPGKIEVQGVAEVRGEKVFVLRFIQARNPEWVQQPFFARFDPTATWLDQLRPAFGASQFFFEAEYAAMRHEAAANY